MKILKSNRILIVEPNTNNLKLYNRKFERLLKLEGIKGDAFRKSRVTNLTSRKRGDQKL